MAWRILEQLRLHEDSEVSDVRGRAFRPFLRSWFHYVTPRRDALYCGPRGSHSRIPRLPLLLPLRVSAVSSKPSGGALRGPLLDVGAQEHLAPPL
eukprot:8438586-Pyramimonas_sp.AAC.1